MNAGIELSPSPRSVVRRGPELYAFVHYSVTGYPWGLLYRSNEMDNAGEGLSFHNGDRVGLVDDDWSLVGHDLILVDLEPVPGSTQCVVKADGETRTVSRARLRPV